MRNKPKIIRIFSYLCLFGYVCLSLFLIYQATLDGTASSNASNTVGDGINNVIDDGKDKTKIINPTTLLIDNPLTNINVGEYYQIKATILPENSSYQSLLYETSNNEIASIDSNGNLEFHKVGTVIIKVKIKDFESIYSEISINVEKIELQDFSYKLFSNEQEIIQENNVYNLEQYSSYRFEYEFTPANATYKDVEYVYDENYLNISNGIINVVGVPNDILEVIIKSDNCIKTVNFKIKEKNYEVKPSEIKINNPISNAKVGTNHRLSLEVLPSNATSKSLVYSSSNTSIATVNSKGNITFKASGEVTIYVACKDYPDIKTELVIVVEDIIVVDFNYHLTFNEEIIEPQDDVYELTQYESYAIHIEFLTKTIVNKKITYEFNKEYFSISNDILTINQYSTDIQKILLKCDGIIHELNVKIIEVVKEEVELIGISAEKESVDLCLGESIDFKSLGITFNPTDVTSKSLNYTTKSSGILTISSTKIKSISIGTDTLVITHEASGLSVEILFTVSNLIEIDSLNPIDFVYDGFVLEDNVYKIINGNSGILNVNFTDNSTYTDVKYESSNVKVITIGEDGLFNPVGIGDATITLTIDDGMLSPIIYEVKISVLPPPHIPLEDFSVENTAIELVVGQIVDLSVDPFGVIYYPDDASNKSINYKVIDKNVVKIESMVLKALRVGTTEIKLINKESNKEQIVVIVVKNIISFEENVYTIKQEYLKFDSVNNVYTIRNGISGKISVNFTENSTYKKVKFNSSNPTVLTVGNDGIITPLKVGKAKVIIEIDDGFDQKYLFEVELVVERTPLIEDMKEFYYTIRKSIGHFAAFFVLGMLGALAFSIIFDKKKWLFSIPMNCVLGFMIAGLTEFIQKYVPGRYGCWDDVWLDYAGYLSATIIFTTFVMMIYLFVFLKRKKIK